MRWIEYEYFCNESKGITFQKKVEYNEANLAIAQQEAVNGDYNITEDDEVIETQPLAIELGGTGAKTASEAREKLGITAVLEMVATIPASGWIVHPGNTGGYYQNVSVAGILTTDTKNQVDLDTSSISTTSADVILSQHLDAAWGEIYRSRIMSNGTVRFYAYEKPDVDLPFRIIVWR